MWIGIHYPVGAFRAIDDTLNSLHRPVSSGPLQNSIDVIHSVCRGQSFEYDYQAIIGLRMQVVIGYVRQVRICKRFSKYCGDYMVAMAMG